MSSRIDKSSLRRKILRCLGEFPPASRRVHPEPKTLEAIRLEDHTREAISYFVEPGEKVTALLLVPRKLDSPAPGMLALHQRAVVRQTAWRTMARRSLARWAGGSVAVLV